MVRAIQNGRKTQVRLIWSPIEVFAPGDRLTILWSSCWSFAATVIVTEVRVQRVQDISYNDVRAEGIEVLHHVGHVLPFRDLWNKLHGPEAWATNPEVSALTFVMSEGTH